MAVFGYLALASDRLERAESDRSKIWHDMRALALAKLR